MASSHRLQENLLSDSPQVRLGRILGHGRVRMALVAPLAECVEAAERIRVFLER
ncbi:succinyldiaminopimelate transaminase [compost metagenome]|jgi:hypothetical protein